MPRDPAVDDEDNRVPYAASGGVRVEDCASVKEARARVGAFLPSVVITDLVMPGSSGIDLLREIRADFRGRVIVLSGKGTIEKAVEAIKEGADDFLEKPLNFQKLRVTLDKLREKNEILEENRRLRELLAKEGTFGRLRGRSRKMLEVYAVIEQVAPSQIQVLITGESGTGKELVARTIHDLSLRRKGPFIAINAAAIPRELIESELFGHERGAFRERSAQVGCFEWRLGRLPRRDRRMEEGMQLLRVLRSDAGGSAARS
jgi:DNA-binding NtrC family response regulator